MNSVLQLVGPALASPLHIVDVGAMSTGEEPPYARLLGPRATLTGFEPQARECAALNAAAKPGQRFLPYYVGDGSERTFYECALGACSSLYEPDVDFTSRFAGLSGAFDVASRSQVQTKRLDDMPEIEQIDYIKMDIQGGERDAIVGGARRLARALVVDVEVEFVPLYKGQPLFADVDAELRRLGFLFHTFAGGNVMGRALRPLQHPGGEHFRFNQLMWADAVYVRDPRSFPALPLDDLLKIAIIMHDAYLSPDLAACALEAHDQREGTRYAKTLLDFVRSVLKGP